MYVVLVCACAVQYYLLVYSIAHAQYATFWMLPPRKKHCIYCSTKNQIKTNMNEVLTVLV